MKKTFEVIKTVLTWLIVLLAVCMMVFTIVSVTTFDRNDRALFGYKMYIVRSDSMSATDFKAGDLILVRSVDPTTLQPGDIIAFTSQDSANFGETVTHKIRSLTTDADGQPAFITYGTTTDTDDEMPVTYPYVLGKYEKCLSGVGNFFQFLKTTPGYILCIFLPFFLLILMEGINCVRLFKRYKSEEQREIQAQQAKSGAPAGGEPADDAGADGDEGPAGGEGKDSGGAPSGVICRSTGSVAGGMLRP